MARRTRRERTPYSYRFPKTRRLYAQWLILITRVGVMALIIAALVTGKTLLVWLALPFWLLAWSLVYLRRRMFLQHQRVMFCLGPEQEMQKSSRSDWPGVTLIAPARNEEDCIEPAVRRLMALDYPCLEIIAVNDHSTDRTGKILEQLRSEFPALRVLHDPPVQEGWLGKANAIWRAIEQADASNEWLLLSDADVMMHPNTLRLAVDYAEREGFDFLTCVPFLDNGSFGEELILAPGWGSMIHESDMEKFNRKSSPAIGVGAFTLVRRRAYLESGGHSVCPGQQPEDTILAETVKLWGGRMGIMWSASMVRVRLYAGFLNTIRTTVRKNRVGVNNSALTALAKAPLWTIPYVLPLPAVVLGIWHQVLDGFSIGLSLFVIGGAMMYVEYVRIYSAHRRLCRMRAIVPWLHPITGLLRVWIELCTAWQILLRRPMTWRGRTFEHRVEGRPAENSGSELMKQGEVT